MLKSTAMIENPFFHRGPVHNSKYFFGRSRDIRRILQLVKRGQSVSIVGPRRIGKSSLLWQIWNPEVAAQFNISSKFKFVFIDCQEFAGDLNRSDIYRELLDAVFEVVRGNQDRQPFPDRPIDYLSFEKQIAQITRSKLKIIFIFDEFEVLTRNHHLDKAFFTQLRALGQKKNVIYITASGAALHELSFHDRNILTSPFFNIFSTQWLRLMPYADVHALITGLLQMVPISFDKDDLVFIKNLAGTYPFFVQLAAYLLFEEKLENLYPDYHHVHRQFMRESKGHFNHMWRDLSEDERQAIYTIARDAAAPGPEIIECLEQKCLVRNGRVFSAGFTEFVLNKERYYPLSLADSFNTNGLRTHIHPQNNLVVEDTNSIVNIKGDIKPAHRIFVREMLKYKNIEEAHFQVLYDGYANYGMYLVDMKPPNQTGFLLSNVLKFASARDIWATQHNYKKFVKDRLSIAFPDDPEFWFHPDLAQLPQSEWMNELAASMYRYALTDGESVHNLQEIYQQWLAEQQDGVVSHNDPIAKVLRRLFRALDRWQDNVKLGTRLPPLIDEYKRLHHKLEKMEASAVKILELNINSRTKTHPQQFRYHEYVTWRGRQFKNPIFWVDQLFQQPSKNRWLKEVARSYHPGIIHGDLNFRNILVEKSEKDLTSIWLIDFSDTHAGHPLRDYGTLEADLKFVITPILAEDFDCVDDPYPPILLLEKLLLSPVERQEIDLKNIDFSIQNIRFQAIWNYSRQIRRKVRRDILVKSDVRPYYLSLLHATLPAVYYLQLSQWHQLYAFLSAALICEKIDSLEDVAS